MKELIMKKVLFIDRDGTVVLEPQDYQIDAFEKIEFYPRVFYYLGKIARELDFDLVMVTNQDGLGTPSLPEENFWGPHNLILKAFTNEGIEFRDVFIDETFAHENAPTRKPNTGLLTNYLSGDFDLKNSFVIGDRLTDVELAKNIGAKGIWINTDPTLGAEEVNEKWESLKDFIALTTTDWAEIYSFLKLTTRWASVQRKTKETNIQIELNLDGAGKASNQTGLGFLTTCLTNWRGIRDVI